MIATSYGLGPFKPAIRWHSRIWVAAVTFENEDDAINAADGVVALLDMRALDYITSLGYMPSLTP